VLIVEDTSTTGSSPLDAAQAARDAGATVVAVATIADRATGAAEKFADAGLEYRHVFGLADLGLA
jgi:orotate phosphoribosyltransferase